MDKLLFFSVSEGVSDLLQITSGSGFPKLYENYGVRAYGLSGEIVATDNAFVEISHVTTPLYATALCQTSGSDFDTAISQPSFSGMTIIAGSVTVRYQATPETDNGWRPGATLTETGFRPSDAIAGLSDVGPILIGNRHIGTEARVVRATTLKPSFAGWAQSDSGLPTSGVFSRITDLEIAE